MGKMHSTSTGDISKAGVHASCMLDRRNFPRPKDLILFLAAENQETDWLLKAK